ncbi:toll/interleukin-1 receptor domain-containing adapter protein [Hoplias malabaricus]|uniref:toll/interleukin-1 receptor domain-containing adapter protein n=1 Tax=Hoplias malabaricus TaxID=27720 RepID=UPI0034630E1E
METKYGSSIFGWFRQKFGKSRNESILYCGSKNTEDSGSSSRGNSSSLNCSCDTSTLSDCATSSQNKPPPCPSFSQGSSRLLSVLKDPFRWTFMYDVCVCHCEENISQAYALVSFLESPSRGLRCYLQTRDCPVGGAVSTEVCKAIESSHCWVLLISPNFLRDDWCLYQMHQVICEGPMSQRIIPAVLDMHISQIPHELRFFYTVDLSKNHEKGYVQVYRTVLQYLKDSAVRLSKNSTEGHAETSITWEPSETSICLS